MKKFMSALCAGSLSLAVGLTSVAPTLAAPIMPIKPTASSNIEPVQYKEHRRKRPGNRPGINRPGNHHKGHWNNYRGQRHQRPGYRRHSDGMWYPLAAFGLGAIIGGAIANQPAPPPAYRSYGGNAHVQWCYDRYRSYRASDNTFQPYNGPRQQCYSPY